MKLVPIQCYCTVRNQRKTVIPTSIVSSVVMMIDVTSSCPRQIVGCRFALLVGDRCRVKIITELVNNVVLVDELEAVIYQRSWHGRTSSQGLNVPCKINE